MNMVKNETQVHSVHTDSSVWRRLEYFRKSGRVGPSILDRYIFNEIFMPFLVALLFWTTLLMSVVLKDIVGELLGKGIPLIKILKYLGYLIGEKLTQTIPMAALFSGIMAAGRLSGDSEITAMRSAGISFPRIYSIFLFFGFLAMLLVAFMNFYYGPVSSRAREDFEEWLKTYHSLTLVRPGRFLGRADMDGVSRTGQDIYAEKRTGDILNEVQIREWFNKLDENNTNTVRLKSVNIPIGDGFITQIVHARTGELLARMDETGNEEKFIRLHNGFIVDVNPDTREYQVTNFLNGFMDYVIPPPVKPLGRLNVRPDNYTFLELFEFLEKLKKGGHTIDLCSLDPTCKTQGLSSKMGESTGDSGHVFTLPAYSEMATTVAQLQFWLFRNGQLVGKEGGPTRDQFQGKVRLYLQLSTFMKDAAKTRLKFEIEIQKRMATAVASILFFFISFPLGLVVKRSGKGMGFALALVVFFIYYMVLTLGLSQAYSGSASPVLGAWLPDIVIGFMGIYIMSSRTEGFSPLGFLMTPFRYLRRKLIDPVLPPLVRLLPLERLQAALERSGIPERLQRWKGGLYTIVTRIVASLRKRIARDG